MPYWFFSVLFFFLLTHIHPTNAQVKRLSESEAVAARAYLSPQLINAPADARTQINHTQSKKPQIITLKEQWEKLTPNQKQEMLTRIQQRYRVETAENQKIIRDILTELIANK